MLDSFKYSLCRNSYQRCSLRKGVLRNFAKFTEKRLCQSRFFIKLLHAEAYNFIEKETLVQVFSCEFCEISKNAFFTEHLCATDATCGSSFIPTSSECLSSKSEISLLLLSLTFYYLSQMMPFIKHVTKLCSVRSNVMLLFLYAFLLDLVLT